MRGTSCFFNLITLLFALLTAGVLVIVLASAAGTITPPLWAVKETVIVPTLFGAGEPGLFVPTFTPSATVPPTATLTPTTTLTPSRTPTRTPTGTPPPSATASASPSPTLPPPTATATATLTFTPSFTPTFTPSPTGPTATPTATLSPYPFMIQLGTPILRDNYANGAGCTWQGMAGQIVKDTGDPVIGVNVRVTGETISEQNTLSGTATIYGPSGWEVAVSDAPNTERYRVELWAAGVQVSPTVEITFPGSCQQNLAVINFVQTRPVQ